MYPHVTGLLLCLCLGLLLVAVNVQGTLDAADERLDALTSRVTILTDQLDQLLKQGQESSYTARRLAKILDHFQDSTGGCEVGFFPCSPGTFGSVQCVRDYLVCDGSADCKNGADEANGLCENPFSEPVSVSVVGFVNDCEWIMPWPENQPDWLIVPIVPTIAPWFPSRPRLYWMYHYALPMSGADSSATLEAWADYDFATGDLILDFHSSHRVVGRIWRDVVSAEKTRYVFDLHRAHGTRDERCMFVYAVMKNTS